MKKLNPILLSSEEFLEHELDSASNSAKPRGSYNPMQFVVRLRNDIHEELKKEELTFEKIQAFSTFMHENIHWWQHVGSFFGFISSLSYPAIAHIAQRDLKTLVQRGEKYKSIIKFDAFLHSKKIDNQEVNRILNYWYDIYYAKAFAFDNKNIHKIINDRRFFLSVGHCYNILWSSSIHVLASVIDKEYKFLPDVRTWDEEFQRLKNEKVDGFYPDSSNRVSSLGIRAIYEGQARFNQLQYLAIGSNNLLSYSDFEQNGMLKGIYIEAFDLYLKLTNIKRPDNLNNSVIALFLLVCDIAINPTDGFPHNIHHYESFIISNDPGIRFSMLCYAIGQDKDNWEVAIKDYSSKEYINLCEKLCEKIACFSPHLGTSIVKDWGDKHTNIQELLEEEKIMKYRSEYMPIGLFFSKFLRFQEDKFTYPHVFCWIGKSMTDERHKDLKADEVIQIFDKHRALYIDDVDEEIHPMLFDGFPAENVEESFNKFYAYNTTYDMIVKWIRQSGEFTYDYHWLTPKYSDDEMKKWIRENFNQVFGIYPEELKIK